MDAFDIELQQDEIDKLQKAWELVERLAASEYNNSDLARKCGYYLEDFDIFACKYCHAESDLIDFVFDVKGHEPDCVWLQALQLVEGK